MTLGEYLRAKRQTRRIEPIALAKLVGCSRQHLHQIERDETIPGIGVLVALAKQLHLSQKESDEMFHLAGRLPPDVMAILKAQPRLFQFIRDNRRAAGESGATIAMSEGSLRQL